MEEFNKTMMKIHTPQSFEDGDQRDSICIQKGNWYARELYPAGLWITCDNRLEYKKYTENDEEIYIEIDNRIPLTNCKTVIIDGLCRDRYSELKCSTIAIKNENITEYMLVEAVQQFYHCVMNKNELKEVSKTDDRWGYNAKAQNALDHNTELKRHEIMGDCVWFEGMTPHKISKGVAHYKLSLGS